MSGYVSDKDKKELCLKSGNRCAVPSCHQPLVVDDPAGNQNSIIAVMAHIRGENAGAARFDFTLPEEERNRYKNLILVCPTCHKIIDDQQHIYTVQYLLELKDAHEKWISSSLKEQIANVTFAELAEVMKYIGSVQISIPSSLEVITPKDKILKNHLSAQVEGMLVMGLTQVVQVKEFLNSHHDIRFAERLVDGFVKEYKRLKYVEQLEADGLFWTLLDFSSDHRKEFIYQAAGLAVLSYLFEKCEVFEK